MKPIDVDKQQIARGMIDHHFCLSAIPSPSARDFIPSPSLLPTHFGLSYFLPEL